MYFLFWNTNRKDGFERHLPRLACEREMIIGLAECTFRSAFLEDRLQRSPQAPARFHALYQGREGLAEHLHLYATFPKKYVRIVTENPRYVLLSVALPHLKDFTLGLVHLQGKLFNKPGDQRQYVRQFLRALDEVERAAEHDRTLIMGDFNLLPFEEAMADIGHFNCTFYRDVVRRTGGRRRCGEDHRPLFYNPMLRLAGSHPPATYHHARAMAVQHFWHQFDQVLVRPALVESFVDDDLKIIDHDGERSLLTTDGIPDRTISDHLPFRFRMIFEPREVTS